MRERMAKPTAVAADAPRNAAAPSASRAATGTTDVVLSAIFKLPTVYSRLRLARSAMQRAVARYLARSKEKPR